MRVLIIGGYGTFGARLAVRLSRHESLTLYIAGRSAKKAQALCAQIKGAAELVPLALDKTQPLAPQLSVPPDVIIDAAGPFQDGNPAKSAAIAYALERGLIYMDLADDRKWGQDVCAMDAMAQAAGARLIAGLSTYPVLTAAALAEIEAQIGPATSVWAGIAPSPLLPMGRNVIAAILSYAGERRAAQRRGGETLLHHGLTETRRARIAPPGAAPLGPLTFINVDAPDILALPHHVKELWCSAATRPRLAQALLVTAARLRRYRLLPPLRLFTSLVHSAQNLIQIGEARSGMIVSAQTASGVEAGWHLIATDPDGPNIPILPPQILIEKIMSDDALPPGARHGARLITLGEFRRAWADLKIVEGVRVPIDESQPHYHRVLGAAYDRLPQSLQQLHNVKGPSVWRGSAKVTRGKNPLAHLICTLFRFPKSAEYTPVTVRFDLMDGRELWQREFGTAAPMRSTQEAGTGRREGLILERFGPITVKLAMIIEDTPDGARLRNVAQGWSIFGLPLPRALCPGGDIYEYEKDGRFHFHVDLDAPLIGRLVKYEGALERV